MNVSSTYRLRLYVILFYTYTAAAQRTTTTPKEAITSVESREGATGKRTTQPANRRTKLPITPALEVTSGPQADVTQLKKTISQTETCQMRKSERSLRFQLDECQNHTVTAGKRNRKVKVDDETKRTILSLYSGMFFTPEAAQEIQNVRKKKKTSRTGRSTDIDHDGDMCCPSVSGIQAAPSVMININNQSRDVVHFDSEGTYQYIETAYCMPIAEQSCSGICIEQTRTVFLLVWKDPLPSVETEYPLTFEPFEIPSFCSCKNIVL